MYCRLIEVVEAVIDNRHEVIGQRLNEDRFRCRAVCCRRLRRQPDEDCIEGKKSVTFSCKLFIRVVTERGVSPGICNANRGEACAVVVVRALWFRRQEACPTYGVAAKGSNDSGRSGERACEDSGNACVWHAQGKSEGRVSHGDCQQHHQQ